MKNLYVLIVSFLLSSSLYAAVDCNNGQINTLEQEIIRINALGLQDAAFKAMLDNSQEEITKAKADCAECQQKQGEGWEFGESSGSKQCVCVGVLNGNNCTICTSPKVVYQTANGEKCLEAYNPESASIEYCQRYGLTMGVAPSSTEPARCEGTLRASGRSIATSTGTTGTVTEGTTPLTSEQLAHQAVLDDVNATAEQKEAACIALEKKWKKNKGECVEKGGLFGGGGGGGGLLGDIDFDSVTSVAGEALGNETVQNALLGAGAGMGIGMVTSKFFSQTCEDEIKDDKCFDAAIELKKSEALRGHCEENKAKKKCQEHFFANDRGFFKTNWCDDEENVMDADMKTKCFNISKDSYFETHCTEEKMENLKTKECFEMKTSNPKKFFEIYCAEGAAVSALPEFKSAGADRECAVMKKNPSINEDYDPDEESEDEDENEDEGDDYDSDDDSDDEKDEDDSDDVADYDSDEDSEDENDDSEDMDDSDEVADSDDDEDGDLFADSDTGRAIASMEHSSVSQDLSASSDDKIMQLANMGHFNSNPAMCEGSIYQVDSNCSMRKHANYLIKGKLGRVKIVGQKTLVCVYENHTGARFSAVIKKDCQL